MIIPDYCEALTGWRVWWCYPDGQLGSLLFNSLWVPRVPLEATCDESDHPAPGADCGCGVYAVKQESDLNLGGRALQRHDPFLPALLPVWGSVRLWGRVMEHEIGWRAQFAYPSELWCFDRTQARLVGAMYRVPCVWVRREKI